jgi:hypothetical protein
MVIGGDQSFYCCYFDPAHPVRTALDSVLILGRGVVLPLNWNVASTEIDDHEAIRDYGCRGPRYPLIKWQA